jgi:hemoglobin
LATDPTLGKFFAGHGKESSKRIRQLVVDQLCAVTGGPCFYVGRDMRSVHQGMNITEADWDRSIGHLKATLGAFKVPAAEQGEVLGALGGLKVDIVEMKH